MKVAILGTRGFPNIPGGVEKHCEGLTVNLFKLGCDVIAFTRKPYVDSNIKEFKGVKLVSLPTLKHKSLETFLHTFTGVFAALKYKPDILHIQAIGPALFTPFARLLGMKVVITSHGSNYKHLRWGCFAKLVLRLGEFLGVIFANKIIAISETIADEIKSKYHKNVEVIPNGVMIPQVLESENILKKHALDRGKYILSVGRFVPDKGFHDLIDAFNRIQGAGVRVQDVGLLPPTTCKWKIVIVGDADHEDKYSLDLKEKAGKNSNTILTGFLTGKPLQELYSHAGLFVLPSYYEGLPIVLLEAMSYGLSCIASDIPANRNVELSGDRYFKPGNVDVLCEKLQEFIAKPFTVEEKKEQMKRIVRKYNWEKIASKTLEVYRKAV